MNDATETTQQPTEVAPRRSGRERKQAESVYTDAKRAAVAERKKKRKAANAKNAGNVGRTTR